MRAEDPLEAEGTDQAHADQARADRAGAAIRGAPSRQSAAPSSQGVVAYAALRQRIIRCELVPGEHITESQLASEIGFGKTPVREALTRLAQEGLVRSMRGHGYEVTPVTLGDVQDLFNFRLIVEPAAAQLAAGQVSGADLRRLDALCATRFSSVDDEEGESEYLHANYQFHTTIADASGNRRLAEAVRRALDGSERLFHLGNVLRNRGEEVVAHEHKELVEALIAGDAETARKLIIAHIAASQRLVLDALLTSPSVLAVNIQVNIHPLRRRENAAH